MASITDYLEQYEKNKKSGLGQPAGKLDLAVPTTPAQNVGSEMLPQIPMLPQGQAEVALGGQIAAPQVGAIDPISFFEGRATGNPNSLESIASAGEMRQPAAIPQAPTELAAPTAFNTPDIGLPSASVGQVDPTTPFFQDPASQVNPMLAPQDLSSGGLTTAGGQPLAGFLAGGQQLDPQGRMIDPNVDRSSFDQASADRETRAAEGFDQPRGPDSRDRDGKGTMSMEDATQLTGGNRDAAGALLKRQELGLGEFKAETPSQADILAREKFEAEQAKGGNPELTETERLNREKLQFTKDEAARKAGLTKEELATEAIDGRNRDFAAAEAMFSSNQNISEVGQKAQRQAGQNLTTGIAGAILSKLKPGSNAADMQANLDTLTADAAFSSLQTMRDNSKTGGALGAISERELTLLGAAQRSLAASQSPEQLKTNISAYLKLRAESMARVKAAFAKEYSPAEANRIFGGGSEKDSSGAIPNDQNTTSQAQADVDKYNA